MRKKFLPGVLMVMLFGLLMSCNNDNDDAVVDAKELILLNKYPNAQNVTWGKSADSKYDIATFTLARTRTALADTVNVWFGSNNDMRLIKEEISFDNLSADIKAAFDKAICRPLGGVSDNTLVNTRYNDPAVWEVDDVYQLEKDGVVSYRIEMETVSSRKNEVEMVLIYDVQGILLNEYEAADDDDEAPLEVPAHILKWIDANFAGSDILDYEQDDEDGEIEHEIDLKSENIIIEVELTEVGGQLTIKEIEFNFPSLSALPVAVKEKAVELIDALDSFTVADVCEIEMEYSEEGEEVYEIELRNANDEIELTIIRNEDGTVTVG